jgi:hypothetical protein
LIAKKQEKPIELGLFEGDINKIQEFYPDAVDLYGSRTYGKMTITPDMVNNTDYKFYIESGTSMLKDNALQNQNLSQILGLIMKSPQIIQAMREKGKDIDMAELIKRWVSTSGIEDWEKIITKFEQPTPNMTTEPGGVQGIDLSGIQDPQIQELAQQMFGQGGQNGQPGQASPPAIGGAPNIPPAQGFTR